MCRFARCSCSLLAAALLCFQLLHTSQAFKLKLRVGLDEEKVPLAVIVPDPTPVMSAAPLAAPPPVSGGGDDDMRPRLPTERWRRGHGEVRRGVHPPVASVPARHAPAPSAAGPGPARAPSPGGGEAPAPAPDSGSGAEFISSSPAVPVPRGVTDTATILPMPAPGEKRQIGAAATVRADMVPLVLGLITMVASFGL